jgi:hypothetical protein
MNAASRSSLCDSSLSSCGACTITIFTRRRPRFSGDGSRDTTGTISGCAITGPSNPLITRRAPRTSIVACSLVSSCTSCCSYAVRSGPWMLASRSPATAKVPFAPFAVARNRSSAASASGEASSRMSPVSSSTSGFDVATSAAATAADSALPGRWRSLTCTTRRPSSGAGSS